MACVVYNCPNKKYNYNTKKNSFFRFPKDVELKKQWVTFCGREKAFNLKDARICNEHFRPEDIRGQMQFEMGLCKTRSLVPGAVPSINKNHVRLAQRIRNEKVENSKNKKLVKELLNQSAVENEPKLINRVCSSPEELFFEVERVPIGLGFPKAIECEEESVIYLNKCRICYEYFVAGQSKDLREERYRYLLEEIKLIAGISIKIQHDLPHHICASCLSDLKRAIHFRQVCHRTEKRVQCKKQLNQITDPFDMVNDNTCISNGSGEHLVSGNELLSLTIPKTKVSKFDCNDNEFYEKTEKQLQQIKKQVKQIDDPFDDTSEEDLFTAREFPRSAITKTKELNLNYNETKESDCEDYLAGKNVIYKIKNETQETRSELPTPQPKTNDVNRFQKIQASQRNFICDKCGLKFQSPQSLRTHLARHDGVKKYQCSECPKKFYTNSMRTHHVHAIHRNLKPFSCRYCNKTFSYSTSRYLHEKNLHSQNPVQKIRYSCHLCETSYVRKNDLQEHMNKHTGEKPFRCRICGKAFERHKVAKKHERIHNPKSYKCAICSEVFSTFFSFNAHKRSHIEPLPYRCEFCDVAYKYVHQLNAHRRTKMHSENELILNACLEVDSDYVNT